MLIVKQISGFVFKNIYLKQRVKYDGRLSDYIILSQDPRDLRSNTAVTAQIKVVIFWLLVFSIEYMSQCELHC